MAARCPPPTHTHTHTTTHTPTHPHTKNKKEHTYSLMLAPPTWLSRQTPAPEPVRISGYIWSEEYNNATREHDIALLLLDRNVRRASRATSH